MAQPSFRGTALGRRLVGRRLDRYRKSQYADYGHGDQPSQPFDAVEAQQPAVAPNMRGHDTTPWPPNRFTRGYSGKHNPCFWRPELRGHPPPDVRNTPSFPNAL